LSRSKVSGFAVGSFDLFHNQIRVQLDAHAAGGFHGLEIDSCGG